VCTILSYQVGAGPGVGGLLPLQVEVGYQVERVAVCCCVLLCVAVRCSVLQCFAVCCNVLRCIVVYCGVLQSFW